MKKIVLNECAHIDLGNILISLPVAKY